MPLLPGSTVILGGITAKVYVDGYKKGNSFGGGPWRTIVYQVAWDDSDNFADALLGIPILSGGRGGTITFPSAHRYPLNTRLVCQKVDGEPVGVPRPDEKLFASDLCRIVAEYSVPSFDFDGSQPLAAPDGVARQFVSWSRRTHIELTPLDASSLDLDAGGSGGPITHDFQLAEPVTEWTCTRFALPYMPSTNIDNMVGSVNATTFLGYPKGQVKLDAFDVNPESDTGGNMMFQAVMVLSRKSHDWNSMWSPKKGVGWVVVNAGVDGSSRKIYTYPYDDLNKVFS